MYWLKLQLKSDKGFSLVEVLVSTAVLSVVILSFLAFQNLQLKSERNLLVNREINNLYNKIAISFSLGTGVCSNTLQGKSYKVTPDNGYDGLDPTNGSDFNAITMFKFSPTAPPFYKVGDPFGASKVYIDTATILPPDHITDNGILVSKIELVFKYDAPSQNIFESKTITRYIPLIAKLCSFELDPFTGGATSVDCGRDKEYISSCVDYDPTN